MHARLKPLTGWPWVEFARTYRPGTDDATALCDEARRVPMFVGHANFSMLGQLAVTGCEFLAGWTGEATWSEGVWEAGQRLILARAAETETIERRAAAAVLDAMATTPGLWTEDMAAREVLGWFPKENLPACKLDHDDYCTFVNVHAAAFRDLTELPPQQLARTTFRAAVYTPEAVGLTRKAMLNGRRVRVVTTCIPALEHLAEPPALAPMMDAIQSPPPRIPAPVPAPVTAPEPVAAPAPVATTPAVARVWEASDAENLADALDQLDPATTDLVGSRAAWKPEQVTGDWSTSWKGRGTASGVVRHTSGRTVRVWRTEGKVTPTEYAAALESFTRRTGLEFWSVPDLAIRLIREAQGPKNVPAFQLPKDVAESWGRISHPRYWGDRNADAQQYDKNKAHLTALTTANLAPVYEWESWTEYGPDAPVDGKHAGMYLVEVPEWFSPLPAPLANATPGTEVWTTAEVVRLYRERGISVRIVRAMLAPVHTITAIERFTEQCKAWLVEFDGDPARLIVKQLYQAAAGKMASQFSKGTHDGIYRPDWGNAIADNSWCNVLRRAYAAHDADPRFVPVRVNVDALYYPRELGDPPGLPIGDKPGQFSKEA